ncbi:unnamed protein product [Brachionus calyciflorus]|uniref:Ras-associating domain-containing protein n=1 Tax=Brachionus calyciflorus TaxID=104777 RepID=A0A813VBR2_9BILA|nr:unnamed protein product [Brachionus calyciflorus]
MNTNQNITNAIASILNAATITASANLSASAGIYSKPNTSSQFKSSGLNTDTAEVSSLSPLLTTNTCLNSHTLFKSESFDDKDTFLNDKLLHQIGTNLVDLSVCWHKMSEEKALNSELIENISPLDIVNDDTVKVDEFTKKTFREEFSSIIIKSTYNQNTEFDVNQLLDANKDQPIGKLADQIQFLTIQTPSLSNTSINTFVEQIKIFNKYNQSKFNQLKYKISPDENEIEISGFIKIHWNLKNPIKLSGSSSETLNENDADLYSSFKATSIKDLNQKKKAQVSFYDTLSKTDSKTAKSFFRNQTVKAKASSTRGSILTSEFLKVDKSVKTEDEMFIPSYGSTSSICVDNKTTCLKAIKILLEKFHIRNSPEDYSLYKVYQSGEIRELNGEDNPLIQRLYMGPFNEDKLFIMEKGRCVNMDSDVMNLVTLPNALLNALIESSKREEIKEINEFKQKYKIFKDLLQHRLKSLE